MLVSRIARRLHRQDEGIAIIAVVGVMGVGVLLSALILSSIVGGMGFTSATRANLQSQAAAEAGVTAARVGLQTNGDCTAKGGVYTGSVNGHDYRSTIWIRNSAGAWQRGCPAAGSTEVRVIAEGDAANAGVGGNTLGNQSFVEATFPINIAPIVEGPSASAVYIGGSTSTNFSSISITSANSQPGDIHILKGNFDCNSQSVINGSVIVADGYVEISNTCTITGSLKASKHIRLSNNVQIGGDLVAAGGAVHMSNQVKVAGNVFAAGTVFSQGTVGGNVEATGAGDIDAGTIGGNVWVGGNINVRGTVNGNVTALSAMNFNPDSGKIVGQLKVKESLSTWGYSWNVPSTSATEVEKGVYHLVTTKKRVGSILYNQSTVTVPTPQAPTPVSPWVDFKYDPAKWSSSFTIVNWTGACDKTNPLFNTIKGYTSPVLIDARVCGNPSANSPLSFYDTSIAVKTDVAFIVKGLALGKFKMTSADGQPHKVWFLSEDGNPALAGAQCTNGLSKFDLNNGVEMAAPLYGLIYTPCVGAMSGFSKWRGQIYAGGFGVQGGDTLTYMPIGIPGTDLSGKSPIDPNAPKPPAGLGEMTSMRNRTDNGETS